MKLVNQIIQGLSPELGQLQGAAAGLIAGVGVGIKGRIGGGIEIIVHMQAVKVIQPQSFFRTGTDQIHHLVIGRV